jgi:hypothetical protein
MTATTTRCKKCSKLLPLRKPGPGRKREFCSAACKTAYRRETKVNGSTAQCPLCRQSYSAHIGDGLKCPGPTHLRNGPFESPSGMGSATEDDGDSFLDWLDKGGLEAEEADDFEHELFHVPAERE